MKASKTIKITPELERQSEIFLNSNQASLSKNLLNIFDLLEKDSLVMTRFAQEFRKNQTYVKDIIEAHSKAYEEVENAYNWFLNFNTEHPIFKEVFVELDSISNNLFVYPKDNIYSAKLVMTRFHDTLNKYISQLRLNESFKDDYREFYNHFLVGKIDQVLGEEYPPYQLGLTKYFKEYSRYLNLLGKFEANQKTEAWYNYFYLNRLIDYYKDQKTTPREISVYFHPLPVKYQRSNEDIIEDYSLDDIKSAWIQVLSFLKDQDRHRNNLHYENGIILYKDKQLPLLEDSITKDIFEFLYKSPTEEFLVEAIINGIKDEATNESYNELKKETVYQLIKSLNERAIKIFDIPVFIKPSKKVIKIDSSLLN